MDKSTPLLVFFSVVVCCAFLLLCGCQPQQPLHRQTRVMMGTYVEVASPDPRAASIAFAEIARIEKLLSKYDPDSQVSRLNRQGRLQVSPETWFILTKAREFWQASGGAFDVTAGPLMDIWGFTDRRFRVPDDDEIAAVRRHVGMDKIIFHQDDNVVELTVLGMEIDLGAIAKGYALDRAAAVLRQAGVTSCLINAGGQVYAVGARQGKPWQVAIRSPVNKSLSGSIAVTDQSVSTSADYEQFFEAQGRRFGHIMDPRTGMPAQSDLLSVSVFAESGLAADALSTAAIVLGKSRAQVLISGFPGVTARFVERTTSSGHGLQ